MVDVVVITPLPTAATAVQGLTLTIDIDFQEKVEKILAQSTQTMIEEVSWPAAWAAA